MASFNSLPPELLIMIYRHNLPCTKQYDGSREHNRSEGSTGDTMIRSYLTSSALNRRHRAVSLFALRQDLSLRVAVQLDKDFHILQRRHDLRPRTTHHLFGKSVTSRDWGPREYVINLHGGAHLPHARELDLEIVLAAGRCRTRRDTLALLAEDPSWSFGVPDAPGAWMTCSTGERRRLELLASVVPLLMASRGGRLRRVAIRLRDEDFTVGMPEYVFEIVEEGIWKCFEGKLASGELGTRRMVLRKVEEELTHHCRWCAYAHPCTGSHCKDCEKEWVEVKAAPAWEGRVGWVP